MSSGASGNSSQVSGGTVAQRTGGDPWINQDGAGNYSGSTYNGTDSKNLENSYESIFGSAGRDIKTDPGEYMCVIAGKIWKLQEVCDKPGAFPSTKQQNLLQKQQQDAVSNLVQALGTRGFRLPDENERELYCMDHRTMAAA